MRERRHATRPYYRRSHERDRLGAIVTIAFLTGLFLGVTLDRGLLAMTGGL